jgi:20S proteasome alpha/beta subunit
VYLDPFRYIIPQIRQTPVTFILGCRCKNGVVLVADKKITSINEVNSIKFEFKQKIFGVIRHVVFGGSGSTDTFELFRDYIIDQVKSSKDITFDNVIIKLADLVLDINKKRDFRRELYFELLVAIQDPKDKPSTLTRITGYGTKHLVTEYHALGMGGNYVTHILENSWYPEITMEEAVELGYLCIKYIEDFKLHSSVGIDKYNPQLWLIPDDERDEHGEKIDYEIKPETRPKQFERIKKNAFKKFNKLKRSMKQ